MPGGRGPDQLRLCVRGSKLRDGLLKISVGHLIRLNSGLNSEGRTLDLLYARQATPSQACCNASTGCLGSQIDLALRVLDELAQEVNQDVGVQRTAEGLPVHLPDDSDESGSDFNQR